MSCSRHRAHSSARRCGTSRTSPPTKSSGCGAAPPAGRRLYPDLQAAYDAFETPRPVRSQIRLLDPDQARRYLDLTRDRTLEVLAGTQSRTSPELLEGGFVFDLVAAHEAQHAETMLQEFVLGGVPIESVGRKPAALGASPIGPGERLVVPGGPVRIGADADGFAYDCERPAHRFELTPYAIARDPVTCGEFVAFIEDGGYTRDELWTAAGRAWRVGGVGRRAGVLGTRSRGWLDDTHTGGAASTRSGGARVPRLVVRGRRVRPLGGGAAADRGGVGARGHRGRQRSRCLRISGSAFGLRSRRAPCRG